MDQVLRIFRKDLRHLWLRVLVVWLLIGTHAFYEGRGLPINMTRASSFLTFFDFLMPLSFWALIGWLIFEEALPGDRQFWLTRPYDRWQLLASKVLFVLVFINLPLLVSDCYILGAQQFGVLSVIPALLTRQLLLSAWFVLPSFTLATVTSGISQFVLAWLFLVIVPIGEMIIFSLSGAPHIGLASYDVDLPLYGVVLVVFGCGAVIGQYAFRRTLIARLVLIGVGCGFLPVAAGFARFLPRHASLQNRPGPASRLGARVAYDAATHRALPASRPGSPDNFVWVYIPLEISHLPAETLVRGSSRITILTGLPVSPRAPSEFYGAVEKIEGAYWQTMFVRVRELNALKGQLVTLHLVFSLEVVNDRAEMRVPVTQQLFFIPGAGVCRGLGLATYNTLSCRDGLSPSIETAVLIDSPERAGSSVFVLEKHGVPPGLSPLTEVGPFPFGKMAEGSTFVFIPRRSIEKFEQVLDVPGISLSEYVVPRV